MTISEKLQHIFSEYALTVTQLVKFLLDTELGLAHVVESKKGLEERLNSISESGILGRDDVNVFLDIYKAEAAALSAATTLWNMALVYLLAVFEAFMSDIMFCVLVSRPEMLRSEKTLTYKVALELGTVERLAEHMTRRELYDVGYMSCKDQWEYLAKRFSLPVERWRGQISSLVEITEMRNVLAHNKGIVNERYMAVVPKGRYKLGDSVAVSNAEWLSYASVLLVLAKHVETSLKEKFA